MQNKIEHIAYNLLFIT